jgi:xanthine phosphoribosyltransferase
MELDWLRVHELCKAIATEIRECENLEEIYGIIAVTRGGLIPAGILSHELGMRNIDTVGFASYHSKEHGKLVCVKEPAIVDMTDDNKHIIVEDIVDSGKTLKALREYFPLSWPIASVVVKAAIDDKPTYIGYVDETKEWVTFPWEKKHV